MQDFGCTHDAVSHRGGMQVLATIVLGTLLESKLLVVCVTSKGNRPLFTFGSTRVAEGNFIL